LLAAGAKTATAATNAYHTMTCVKGLVMPCPTTVRVADAVQSFGRGEVSPMRPILGLLVPANEAREPLCQCRTATLDIDSAGLTVHKPTGSAVGSEIRQPEWQQHELE
jgi:hypothetical protein